MSVLVPQQRCQGLEGPGAERAAVGPLSRVQAVVGTEAGGAWTAVATHMTPAWVPTLPTTLSPRQVAVFVEQQLGDQPEDSWAQGTVERTWLRGLRYQRGVRHLHHLDLDEVTRGGGRAAIIRHQDLGEAGGGGRNKEPVDSASRPPHYALLNTRIKHTY